MCRLLEKGYKPEHIELEPRWNLGHGTKGGKADILIRDNEENNLLLIECKTAGNEFTKAWRNTFQDGAQLFSYTQQISDTQFLCLYTSDFDGTKLTYISHVIAHRDNDNFLNDNKKLKGFKNARDAKARFAVWRDTYKLDYTTQGIFEPGIQPYHIGKDKYALADLRGISDEDRQKKYNEFATILRQHNVSGRENALDKLVNLFLCKIVDEIENPLDLKFYWKGVAYDTHFELFDRMQQLYQSGMSKFLGEAITYINRNDVFNAMRLIRKNPDATQRAVWELFVRQKFYTNNDFSFIDVHNERLFYQNAEVLLKILQMWQDIRLTSATQHNQFLGDMFEGFLDQGVKQSEGQYFTPVPFCRFIITSLPLPNKIKECGVPPKMIDYACGAGHFLNEYAMQIETLLDKQANIDEYHKAIIGIEKEYRLSKIAKVSAFMYGQQGINVCYGDALTQHHAAFSQIQNNSFDILAANPPYSVSGFLETLPEEERAAYSLADTIDKLDTANSIEAFFIERAKQLLKAGGIAALILPSSILSNGGNTYVKTREVLLQYFDFVAIAEFGSGTFGKTGTKTVTLFLRRKATAPDSVEHYRERIASWFDSDDGQDSYRDAHLLDQYAQHIGVAAEDYRSLLITQPSEALLAQEMFIAYRAEFDKSTEISNLKKHGSFRKKPSVEQVEELRMRFLKFLRQIEQDKLLHFILSYQQANPVLIIRSPEKGDAMKRFLGYDWSERKGKEGINLFKDASGKHNTPLYDPSDRNNPDKIAHFIAQNFDGKLGAIPEALQQYAIASRLVDMLDFSCVTFEKQIALVAQNGVTMQSKWPMEKLGDICSFEYGKPLPEDQRVPGPYPVMGSNGRVGLHNEYLVAGPVIIVGRKGSAGEVIWEFESCFPIDTTFYVKLKRADIQQFYLFQALKALSLDQLRGGSGVPGLNRNAAYQLKIPLPPIDIQQQIVAECEAVDAEIAAARGYIDAAQKDKKTLMQRHLNQGWSQVKLGIVVEVKNGGTPNTNKPEYWDGGDICWATLVDTKEKYLYDTQRKITQAGLKHSTLLPINTVIFSSRATIGEVCINKVPTATNQGYKNFVCNPSKIEYEFLYYLLVHYRNVLENLVPSGSKYKEINSEKIKNFPIPLPPLEIQRQIVTECMEQDNAIATAQATLDAAPAKKQAIMQRYL